MRGTVFITGVSGVGKSSVLGVLADRGYAAVDTDYGPWHAWVQPHGGPPERIWDEGRITRLLEAHREGILFISGCVSNQVRFYARFKDIVVLTAPEAVIMERVRTRANNPYGKAEHERRAILDSIRDVEPLLKKRATMVIDTRKPLEAVADELEALVLSQVTVNNWDVDG